MKKLITLSLISLISITQVCSKSVAISVSSNYCEGNTILTSADLKPENAPVNFTPKKAGKGTLDVLDDSGIEVLKQQVVLVAGKKITINNISGLNEGNCTICLSTSYKNYSTVFVLWK